MGRDRGRRHGPKGRLRWTGQGGGRSICNLGCTLCGGSGFVRRKDVDGVYPCPNRTKPERSSVDGDDVSRADPPGIDWRSRAAGEREE